MKHDVDISPGFVPLVHHAVYNSSIASSASTSAASVWSDVASQSSDDTACSTNSSDYESGISQPFNKHISYDGLSTQPLEQAQPEPVPAELRRNPRRSAPGSHPRGGCPPSLVRQSDRKVNFVDNLVDSSAHIVEAIWPLSSVVCRSELGSKAVLPLRTFIQETLRRSRTSYSTLQVALYYLILIKPHVPKHNFTMEQPDDHYADRALQCGRRMFLAALILASKYLQDRNYSARAWSKISGLHTYEINQNEVAFLLAVDWKLHIADEVFQRWTDIVLNYTPPPSPPSSGSSLSPLAKQQVMEWKHIILGLNVELTNVRDLVPYSPASPASSDRCANSSRGQSNPMQDVQYNSNGKDLPDLNEVLRSINMPSTLEPTPTSAYDHSQMAPSLGMLPTPRLTPQLGGFCTPAAGASTHRPSMGMAMFQANSLASAQYLDRHPSLSSRTPSPQSHQPARRSSLANSVSTASSPESMVSDTSRTSRSSSISSASSLASASATCKLSVPSRLRVTKLWNDRLSSRPSVPSVPESYEDGYMSSSPDSFTGTVGKLGEWSQDTPMARDAASDAARTLQELYHHGADDATPTGCKRSRPTPMGSLHDNVRDLLNGRCGGDTGSSSWPDSLVLAREPYSRMSSYPEMSRSTKRVCCSAEAASGFESASPTHAMSLRRPGMWHGILN